MGAPNDAKKTGILFQYLAALSSALTSMSFGANFGWTSPYVPYLLSNSSTIPVTPQQISWCTTAPIAGCLAGAIMASFLADQIGRKHTILLMAPLIFFGFIGIGLVRNIWYICLCRIAIGVADGALFTVLPMYIGEIADPSRRGFLSSSIILFYISGTLFINAVGPWTTIFASSMMCACISALHFVIFVFMPESPYYYIKVNRDGDAARSLRALKGTPEVHKEVELLKEAVTRQEHMVAKPRFTDLVTVPSNRRAFYIYSILNVTSKMSGKVAVLLCTTAIFEETGSSIDSTLSAIVYNGVELIIVSLTTFFIIDRFGKRFLIITSAGGCGIAVFFLATYFYIKDNHHQLIGYIDWLPITSLVSHNVLFSLGLGFSPISYLSELFPTSVKANALCVAELMAASCSYIAYKIFEVTFDWAGTMSVPFYIFSASSFVGLGFIVKFVPETKGKTLEEIQEFLIGNARSTTDDNEK